LSNRYCLLFCLFFCLVAVLPAWGRKEKSESKKNDTQTIVFEKYFVEEIEEGETKAAIASLVQAGGIVRLVGGGPIPELVITGQDREWYVSREDEHLLKNLQHRTVTVEGYESIFELRFANGLYAGQRRTLKDIKIISIE
jgi:hypothetical protein